MLNIATRMEPPSHVSRHYVFGYKAGWHQCYNHDLHQHAHHHHRMTTMVIINLMFDSCLQALFYLNSKQKQQQHILLGRRSGTLQISAIMAWLLLASDTCNSHGVLCLPVRNFLLNCEHIALAPGQQFMLHV